MSASAKTKTTSSPGVNAGTQSGGYFSCSSILTAKTVPVLLTGVLAAGLLVFAFLEGGKTYPQLYVAGSIVLALVFFRFADAQNRSI